MMAIAFGATSKLVLGFSHPYAGNVFEVVEAIA